MKIGIRKALPADKELIRTLLSEVKLPVENVDSGVTSFYIAEDERAVLGVAGFEFYGDDVLLRSVAIRPGLQQQGIGSQVVGMMIAEARRNNVNEIVLLTETAKDFFLARGFKVVDRSTVSNDAMRRSSEFAYACPKSAVCMRMYLK